MKKADVVVGGVYWAKVSGKRVWVKVLNKACNKGWTGLNLTTGREIHIKTAARLSPIGGNQ